METYIDGEPAPVQLELSDYRGGWTLIAFFPPGMAAHPELAEFDRLRHAFAAENCLLLAVSIDSWWQLRETPAAFPLVADTHGLLAASFGALADGEPRFGTVLLDPDGVVVHEDLGRAPDARATLRALRALRGRPLLRLVA